MSYRPRQAPQAVQAPRPSSRLRFVLEAGTAAKQAGTAAKQVEFKRVLVKEEQLESPSPVILKKVTETVTTTETHVAVEWPQPKIDEVIKAWESQFIKAESMDITYTIRLRFQLEAWTDDLDVFTEYMQNGKERKVGIPGREYLELYFLRDDVQDGAGEDLNRYKIYKYWQAYKHDDVPWTRLKTDDDQYTTAQQLIYALMTGKFQRYNVTGVDMKRNDYVLWKPLLRIPNFAAWWST